MIEEKIAIKISLKLYNNLLNMVNRSEGEFSTVEDYIDFILNEITNDVTETDISPEEEEMIKERLKKLGYI